MTSLCALASSPAVSGSRGNFRATHAAGFPRLVVSLARPGHSKSQSFPRKRESIPQTFDNALPTEWIPAFAGMTGIG